MNTNLSRQFVVRSNKDVEILVDNLNNPKSTGRNPHKVKKSPWTIPAIISLVITLAGILAGLMYVPAIHKLLSLLLG